MQINTQIISSKLCVNKQYQADKRNISSQEKHKTAKKRQSQSQRQFLSTRIINAFSGGGSDVSPIGCLFLSWNCH